MLLAVAMAVSSASNQVSLNESEGSWPAAALPLLCGTEVGLVSQHVRLQGTEEADT